MSEEEISEPVTELVAIESIFSGLYDDEKLESQINNAVARMIASDDRFINADIEIVDAMRDWVRAEAILSRAFVKFMNGDTTASTERMFRHAALHKNALRDEIFGKFKGRRAKKEEIDYANKILVDEGCITPKTEVDVLADKKS